MVDVNCPYQEWLFDDLMKSEEGMNACMARPQEWKDANMKRMDYCECDSDDYKECRWYQVKLNKERTVDDGQR